MEKYNSSMPSWVAALLISVLSVGLGDGCAEPLSEAALETDEGLDLGDAGVDDARTDKAVIWSLSMAQRRALLTYYSPLLMLRADEPSGHAGYSWITNFDFDRDGNFGNNRVRWPERRDYMAGTPATATWQIRPTIYTSLIEFMETNGTKSVILIYHIYHATQTHGIHDWERIELRVNNVSGTPGAVSESIRYVAITNHHNYHYRLFGSSDLNFHQTPTGKHVMIWQAQGSNPIGSQAQFAELKFVSDTFAEVNARVTSNLGAEVHAAGGSERINVHYVFVCGAATSAVSHWNAQSITRISAADLASRRSWDDTTSWSNARRVRYELQDIADIFPTHWEGGNYRNNWQAPSVNVLINNPILSESGAVEVPAGLQTFYYEEVDIDNFSRTRDGYPNKAWFWGTYILGGEQILTEMWAGNSNYPSRAEASGWRISLNAFWWQHDYYAHDGVGARWLRTNWYQPAAGGFDGRWVQMFPD